MSDSEGRLAQRRGIDGREKVVGTYSGPLVRHSASFPKAEIDALRARIRELEAQAARGAAVVEAALEIYPDLANAPVIAAALAAREAE